MAGSLTAVARMGTSTNNESIELRKRDTPGKLSRERLDFLSKIKNPYPTWQLCSTSKGVKMF